MTASKGSRSESVVFLVVSPLSSPPSLSLIPLMGAVDCEGSNVTYNVVPSEIPRRSLSRSASMLLSEIQKHRVGFCLRRNLLLACVNSSSIDVDRAKTMTFLVPNLYSSKGSFFLLLDFFFLSDEDVLPFFFFSASLAVTRVASTSSTRTFELPSI